MRIDFQQGEHLRVGRLCVSVQNQGLPHPFISGCASMLRRIDEARMAKVVGLTEAFVGSDTLRRAVGGASDSHHDLQWVARSAERLSDAITDLHVFGIEVERFGGIAVHVGERLWSVTWLGAGLPRSPRQRWRQLRRRLTRRPAVPMTPTPGAYDTGAMSRSAHPSSAT